jgi:GNAT superfamily N-acetyltransferase
MSAAQGARVRRAAPEDVAAMDAMVRELAEYEREPEAVVATAEDLATALFGADPRVHAHVAEVDGPGGRPQVVGMAIWYLTYSTWTGRHGLWLEDLYVRPAARGTGLGRDLLRALAAECTDRGYRRLEWWVLDWNSPAQGVYRSAGARPEEEWTTWRLDGDALTALAEGRPRPAAPEAAR